MKKNRLAGALALLLISSVGFQSCIGSFSLTNRVLTWNKQVNNKFVNELVFFAFWILPVYEVTAAADLLVINSIEFWSGNNPLEASNRIIESEQGDYLLATTKTGYNVTSPNGDMICFKFNDESKTWSFSKGNDESVEFLRFIDENHVQVIGLDGQFVDVELNKEGVESYRNEIGAYMMAAL